MTRVSINQAGMTQLQNSTAIVAELDRRAEDVRRRVRLPASHLTLDTRAGRGPRGPFSQVIMRGRNAVGFEFGNRRTRPYAPLRSALGGSGR